MGRGDGVDGAAGVTAFAHSWSSGSFGGGGGVGVIIIIYRSGFYGSGHGGERATYGGLAAEKLLSLLQHGHAAGLFQCFGLTDLALSPDLHRLLRGGWWWWAGTFSTDG